MDCDGGYSIATFKVKVDFKIHTTGYDGKEDTNNGNMREIATMQ